MHMLPSNRAQDVVEVLAFQLRCLEVMSICGDVFRLLRLGQCES